jgi:hypothetical protein
MHSKLINSIWYKTPENIEYGEFAPINVKSIEVLPGPKLKISIAIDFHDEMSEKDFIIDKFSHQKIMIEVLSGELPACKGVAEIYKLESFCCDWRNCQSIELLEAFRLHEAKRYIDVNVETEILKILEMALSTPTGSWLRG